MADLLTVKIAKAGRSFQIDTSKLPDEVYALALAKGLADLMQSGITSSKYPTKGLEGDELTATQEAIAVKVEENIGKLYAGEVKAPRSAATTADGKKVSREVMTEARRLAREVVKDEIRAAGEKPSHYEPREITAAANALLESDPTLFDLAKANIETRAALSKAATVTGEDEAKLAAMARLESLGNLKPSAKKKAEAEKLAAERKASKTLSAAKAGQVAPRKSKPQANA